MAGLAVLQGVEIAWAFTVAIGVPVMRMDLIDDKWPSDPARPAGLSRIELISLSSPPMLCSSNILLV